MSLVEKALYYAKDLGFSVFPTHGIKENGECTCGIVDCPNAGKHPATKNGLKDASKSPFRIRPMFTNPLFNIGVVTGAESGIVVVDVDGAEGERSLDALQATHGELPQTLTSLTGRGRHLIFRHWGTKVPNSTSKLGYKIDVRGDGGYIIAPGSKHKSGNYYEWSVKADFEIYDAPEWLKPLMLPSQDAVIRVQNSINTDAANADDIISMLDFIDPDIPYDDWIAIGMAICNAGLPYEVWDNWSQRGGKYQGGSDTAKHWKSFKPDGGITLGTLVKAATVSGWRPAYKNEFDDDDLRVGRSAAAALLQSVQTTMEAVQLPALVPPKSPEPIVPNIPPITGVIGDTINWILETAQLPQPELALLNVIAALGAVFGRRYRSPMDTRTNIYLVGLAGTAGGKNHSKKCVKRLMIEANLLDYLGDESIISGAGMLTSLFRKPSQVMQLDEFGMVLEAIFDKRGATHMKVASKIITELYSSSGERFLGGQYADAKKDPVNICSPNLCIFGISTIDKYTNGINRDAINSGELNRFIVFRVKKDRPDRQRGVMASGPKETLVKEWADFKDANAKMMSGLVEPEVITVPWPGLQERIDDMADFEDQMVIRNDGDAGALWGRYRENCIKIAMIFAIARNRLRPEIKAEDLDIGDAIVQQSIRFMIKMATENMSDSQHEKDCNDIMMAIRRNGGVADKSVIARIVRRLNSKEREAALYTLMEQRKITADGTQEDDQGRKTVVYRIAS